MSKLKSFAEIILDWEKVKAAYDAHPGILSAVQFLREQLGELLNQARQLKGQQELEKAAKQVTTKGIREVVRAGREVTRRIRNHALSMLGSRSELLAAFQVTPLRDRRVRRGQADSEPPTAEEPPAEDPPSEEPPSPPVE